MSAESSGEKSNCNKELDVAHSAQFSIESNEAEAAAWTEIEAGRFMPRRARGSFQGRALG
jgi:hypothetical protein